MKIIYPNEDPDFDTKKNRKGQFVEIIGFILVIVVWLIFYFIDNQSK